MPDKTYKLIEIVGVSDESVQQAIRNGLTKASQTLRNLDWFEVTQIRGAIVGHAEPQFQVEMKVGFRLADRPAHDDGAAARDATGEAAPSDKRAQKAKKAKKRGKAGKRK